LAIRKRGIRKNLFKGGGPEGIRVGREFNWASHFFRRKRFLVNLTPFGISPPFFHSRKGPNILGFFFPKFLGPF